MTTHVIQHPAAGHLLTLLRDKSTVPSRFRTVCKQLAYFLAIEATRHLPTKEFPIETPLEPFKGVALRDSLIAIPILRAGLAMLEPVLDLFTDVSVGYVGMERNETTAVAHTYYCKLPSLTNGHALILDPMLATGGSAQLALNEVKKRNPKSITMVSIVSAPEGIAHLEKHFPEIPIFTAAIDRQLNSKKYILPGLGDFGDRLYGTV